MHLPQIGSVQVPAINHDGANVRLLSQVALGLLEQRDQPAPLILLDFDHLHGQGQARLHLNEDQHFPSIDVIFLCRRFFLSFDFHAAGLLELPAALIALRGRQFTAIQGDQQLAGEHASPGKQLHHLVEEVLHLLLAEFADVVGQALRAERSLLLFRGALRISAFGQPVFALVRIEAHQLHQSQVAKQDAREFIHRLATNEHFEHIQQHKLHGGDQHPFRSRHTHLLKCLHHAQLFQKHKKLIQQPGIAEFMHLVNGFPRIQPLRDPGIISARQLPVESFLHDACFFGCLGDCWLTLHTVVPLPFFLSLSLSPLPHNLLYQNTRGDKN